MSTRSPRRRPGRFRGVAAEERLAQRRRMLIEAGVDVFGTRGFHAATVREICAAARLTERYFYESFDNREALFAAVYEHMTARLRDALVAAVLPDARDVGSMSRAALRTLFASVRDDPRLMRILFVDVFTVSDEVDRMSRRSTQGFADLTQSVVEALYPSDRRGELDPNLLAQGLVGACINTVIYWAYNGFRESLDSVVDNCAALFEALDSHVQNAPKRSRRRRAKTTA